jgi:hypothetical protein
MERGATTLPPSRKSRAARRPRHLRVVHGAPTSYSPGRRGDRPGTRAPPATSVGRARPQGRPRARDPAPAILRPQVTAWISRARARTIARDTTPRSCARLVGSLPSSRASSGCRLTAASGVSSATGWGSGWAGPQGANLTARQRSTFRRMPVSPARAPSSLAALNCSQHRVDAVQKGRGIQCSRKERRSRRRWGRSPTGT